MSSIITKTELDQYLGITTETNRATLVIAAVNQYVDSQTGRSWGSGTSVTEVHDYAPVIFLRRMDVQSVTSVTINGSTVPTSSYSFSPTGRLVLSTGRLGFDARRNEVTVVYVQGSGTVPADLKLAALALASDFYNYADNNQTEVTSEGIGSMRLTYASGSGSSTGKTYFNTISGYGMRNV